MAVKKTLAAHATAILEREAEALKTAIGHVGQLLQDQDRKLEDVERDLVTLEAEIQAQDTRLETLKQQIKAQEAELASKDLLFSTEYEARSNYYREVAEAPLSEGARSILAVLNRESRTGIIVYPNAVHWEPLQRPQHLLIEFSRMGYLCFFCDPGQEPAIREVEDGLYLVARQEDLLQALQTFHVLVLNTYLMQNSWIEHLPHRTVWYDVLDRVDFFSYFDRMMLAKHYQVLHEADIVTYSARKLSEYVGERQDAVYLPNASRISDFQFSAGEKPEAPADLAPILRAKKRILGYYGAIEEWFDTDLVNELAERMQAEVVLIGHCGLDPDRFNAHVHLLGAKPYAELKQYAAYFDALLIPFVVNTLTNAVSPVKFFEYCAVGKPIISTPIAEVLPFAGPGITFVNAEEPYELTAEMWNLTPDARRHLAQIAEDNQWNSRASSVTALMETQPSCWPIYANRLNTPHIGVFTATFFDYEGGNYYTGGAERYLVDLHEVCEELGYRMDVYQYGNYAWYRKYKQIDVYSLGHEDLDMKAFTFANIEAFNRRYIQIAQNNSVLNLYSAFFQAFPQAAHPSIGISHGVAWDNPACQFSDGESFWRHNERFIRGAEQVQSMVSVDTNTANWFQTVSFEIGRRMQTIPNYVDPSIFFPVAKQDDGKIRIVYPRRLYEARGLYITLAIVDEILERYPNTEFHFVGKGFEEDVARIREAAERWPGRVFCYHRDPDDMHLVYKEADIVLIPTLYSEGTSLSCLEACATGNTVIATRVGGLTDIIIDGFNGRLIDPDSSSLRAAVVECLDNRELRLTLGRNAYEVSKAFNKAVWKERWKRVIRQMLGKSGDAGTERATSRSRPQPLEIRLGPKAKPEAWRNEALHALRQGREVFVRGTQANGGAASFGRLQWISEETQLYFQPDVMEFG
ncbi:glycosyltransferase [Paenibacillus sp. GCM10023250]|uniref:glycosyltransferase n=1 Tax=Paenibacillus sp. GCM10023250 TaxID=3252648 RepID=UPI00360B5F5C